MKKYISLIKACMSSDMSLFKVRANSRTDKLFLPIFLSFCLMFAVWTYGNLIMDSLREFHMEFVYIPLSVFICAFMLLMEGIYKSGSLLFNCKDDNLLLSLPIKRQTVIFIRIFKFYTFELLYHTLFFLPFLIIYIRYYGISISFIITSIIMLILLPVIPIVISCIFGTISTGLSSRFKFKKAAQTIISMILLVAIMYFSFNMKGVFNELVKHAKTINDFITMIYYPAGAFYSLITDFKLLDLLLFILINIGLLTITIFILSKIYFGLNSRIKKIETNNRSSNKEYKYSRKSVTSSLIHKEFTRFFKTPIFLINAGFGLVLFIIICILVAYNMNSVLEILANNEEIIISKETVLKYLPLIIAFLIAFGSFTTSITSSMISLEGKSFMILKSLPIEPRKIIMSKVYTSSIIMIPAILLGDAILFFRFKVGIIEMLILIALSIILPFISGIVGIITNLKYPKMDAVNDAEVVKQSMSSMISVFAGFALLALTGFAIYLLVQLNIDIVFILVIILSIFMALLCLLYLYLCKNGVKDYNNIIV